MFDRKRAVLALTFAVLATLLCAPAAFGQATTTDTPFTNQPATNPCNTDTIMMNGTLHTESSFSTNPNGMIHISSNSTLHATGVDMVTGVQYVISDTAHSEVNSKTVAQEQLIGTKVKLIAQGPYPNLTARTTYHLVVDANGNIRVNTSGFQLSCN